MSCGGEKEEGRRTREFIGFVHWFVHWCQEFTVFHCLRSTCVGVCWRVLAFFGLPWFRGSVKVAFAPCAPMWGSSVLRCSSLYCTVLRCSSHTASQFTFAFPFPPLPPPPFPFSIGSVSPPMLGRGPGSVSSAVQQQPMQQQHIFLHGLNSG